MKYHYTQTDSTNELHITAESPRDKSILDIFTNQRQGANLTMKVDDAGNVVLVSAEAR